MAMTQERLEYQRDYRARTGYAASKKYVTKTRDKLEGDINAFAKHMWNSLKKGASKRGIKFKLTLKNIKELLETQKYCAISGREVTYRLGDLNKASVDRIDSNDYYHIDNVQIVTSIANWMKREWDQSVVVELCQDVVRYQRKLKKNG